MYFQLLLDLTSYEDCPTFYSGENVTTNPLILNRTESQNGILETTTQPDFNVITTITDSIIGETNPPIPSTTTLSPLVFGGNESWKILKDSEIRPFQDSSDADFREKKNLNVAFGEEENPCHEGSTSHFPDVSIEFEKSLLKLR